MSGGLAGVCVMDWGGGGGVRLRVVAACGFADDDEIVGIGGVAYGSGSRGFGGVEAQREVICGVDDSLPGGGSDEGAFGEAVGEIGIAVIEGGAGVHHFLHPKRRELFRAQSIVVCFQKLIVACEGMHLLLYL